MTEFDYDVKSRKALVPSARKKINGCKSRRCVLPSDYMTKGELKKMNGDVMTVNLNKPYKFRELEQLPLNLQKEYVQNLRNKYCMSVAMFAQMADVGHSKANKYFKETLELKLGRGMQATEAQRVAFQKFCSKDNNVIEAEAVNDEIEKTNDEVVRQPAAQAWTVAGTWTPPMVAKLAYHGTVRDICEALISALGAGSVGRIEVAFRADPEQKEGE